MAMPRALTEAKRAIEAGEAGAIAAVMASLADAGFVRDALRRRIDRLDDLIAKLSPIRKDLAPVISTGG